MQFGLGDLRVTQEQVPEIRTKDGKDGGFKLPLVCASNPSATRGEDTRTNNKIFIFTFVCRAAGRTIRVRQFAKRAASTGALPRR